MVCNNKETADALARPIRKYLNSLSRVLPTKRYACHIFSFAPSHLWMCKVIVYIYLIRSNKAILFKNFAFFGIASNI